MIQVVLFGVGIKFMSQGAILMVKVGECVWDFHAEVLARSAFYTVIVLQLQNSKAYDGDCRLQVDVSAQGSPEQTAYVAVQQPAKPLRKLHLFRCVQKLTLSTSCTGSAV